MSTNPAYLPQGNPVRYLIDRAVEGHLPTRGELDALTAHEAHLPPGVGLRQLGPDITTAADRVAQIAGTGDRLRARRAAEDEWSRLARRMAPEARAVDGDADPEPLADITARMFTR